jgi:hypothetical protein
VFAPTLQAAAVLLLSTSFQEAHLPLILFLLTTTMAVGKINYAAFASFLSSFPDTFAVKRFRELQIRNLLFYQAELAHLQVELEEIEQKDASNTAEPSNRANFRWTPSMAQEASLSTLTLNPTMSSIYCEKMLQIHRTLASYSECDRLNHVYDI